MRYPVVAALFFALAGPDLAGAGEPGTTAFAQLGPIVVHGNEADNLLLGVGVFDIRDRTSAAGTIEYRFGRKVFVAGLSLGLVANTEGGLYGYVGTYGDLSYKRIYFTPQIAMGGYHDGDSSNLGGVFQFRLSLGCRLSVRQRPPPGGTYGAHLQRRRQRTKPWRGGAAPDLFGLAGPVFVSA